MGNTIFGLTLFHEGSPYYIETSSLICSANQWTSFYLTETSVLKDLKHFFQ